MSDRLADIGVAMQEGIVGLLTASLALREALDEPDAEGVASRVWDSPPGPNETLPYVEVTVVPVRDWGGVGMTEVMSGALVNVKAVDQAEGYEDLRPIAKAIHQALHGVLNYPVSGGGQLLSVRRRQPIQLTETTQGVEYRHLGGQYEVEAQ
jgi:hypothetical protein